MQTWFASCRVPRDEEGQRLQRYERMLRTMTQLDNGLGCPIPDTIVVRKGAGHVYWCDPVSTIVTRQRYPSLERAVDSVFALNGEEDANSVVACWMSERRDSKGAVWSVEYFTRSGIAHYVRINGAYMTGVLQRFINTRLHLGVNEVNQSLMGYFNFTDDSMAVERRYLRDCFINSGEHPTVRACLYPSVPVTGRVDVCRAAAFKPNDLYPIMVERVDVEAPDASALIATTMDRLASALERSRAECYGCDVFAVRPVGFMSAEFRFNAVDDRLYLINVLHVRHLGDTMGPSSGFELAKIAPTNIPMRRLQAVGEDEFAVLSDQMERCGSKLRGKEWIPADEVDGGAALLAGSEEVLVTTRVAPSDRFGCPNCGLLCHAADLTAVPFAFMIDRFKAAHFHRAREGLLDEGVAMEEGYWASLPFVLRKLNVDITKVAASSAWLSRRIGLCAECCNAMEYVDALGPQLVAVPATEVSPLRPPSSLAAVARGRPPVLAPPTCTQSDVIDGFVTTNLQAHHRSLRRAERGKYVATIKASIPSTSTACGSAGAVTRPSATARSMSTTAMRRPSSSAVVVGGPGIGVNAPVPPPLKGSGVRPPSAVSARSRRMSGGLAQLHAQPRTSRLDTTLGEGTAHRDVIGAGGLAVDEDEDSISALLAAATDYSQHTDAFAPSPKRQGSSVGASVGAVANANAMMGRRHDVDWLGLMPPTPNGGIAGSVGGVHIGSGFNLTAAESDLLHDIVGVYSDAL